MGILEYISSGSGSGNGNGSGYGNGNGSGYGSGYGNGYGSGNGNGNGNGSGSGYGGNGGNGDGDGNGDGNGDGYGYGSGDGNGYGDGDGDGSGYGDGDGSGYGDGYGIKEFNGVKGCIIDGRQTFLEHIRGNIARGFVLEKNVTQIPCWVYLTDDGFIAHGETLRKSRESAVAKSLQEKPLEERLADFRIKHPDIDAEYGDLFEWHHVLTGSCEFGRRRWCEEHGLKPTDSLTVRRFITKTINDYGGEVIRILAAMYGIEEDGQ